MSSVFLSHNSKDKPWVRTLAERLIADEVIVWLDEAEINIGDSLIEKISAGIQDMKFVAAIISKNSVESSWVQKEISLAMSKEIAGREVTVLPLVIDNCELPISLSDKLYADFTNPNDFETSYSKLLRALGVKEAPKAIKQQNTSQPKQSKVKPLVNDAPLEQEHSKIESTPVYKIFIYSFQKCRHLIGCISLISLEDLLATQCGEKLGLKVIVL
jgi:hypothetical protein